MARALGVVIGALLLAGCGSAHSDSRAVGGNAADAGGTSASAGAAGAVGNGGSLLGAGGYDYGYGPNGYGFGGYGGDWADPSVTSGGLPNSTAAEICKSYAPTWDDIVEVTRESQCDAVAQEYSFAPLDQTGTNVFDFCYDDQAPGASCTHEDRAISGGWCQSTQARVITVTGTGWFGAGYEIYNMSAWNLSTSSGLGLWLRWASGQAPLRIGVSQTPSPGDSCSSNNDWDHDGYPNLSPPPPSMQCPGFSVHFDLTDQYTFVALPWNSFKSQQLPTARIDPSRVQSVDFMFQACADRELWVAALGSYNDLP